MSAVIVQPSQLGAYVIGNQVVPNEGAKVLNLILNFNTGGPGATPVSQFTIDMSQLQLLTIISIVQTLWIDLQNSDQPLIITVPGINQIIKAKGRTQGYYPITAGRPAVFYATGPVIDGISLGIINVPIQGAVWPSQ